MDWSRGIGELASLSDTEIEKIALDAADRHRPVSIPRARNETELTYDRQSQFVQLRLKGLDRNEAMAEIGRE